MLEKFLTMPQEKFRLYQRSNTDAPLPEKSDKREAFRFSKVNLTHTLKKTPFRQLMVSLIRRTSLSCVHSLIVMIIGYPEAVSLISRRALAYQFGLIYSILKRIRGI